MYQYSGLLLNTASFPWKSEFLRAYETHLRGTKARENNARVYLAYDDLMREGFILNASISQSQSSLRGVNFQFSMFITAKRIFSLHSRLDPSGEAFQRTRANRERDVAILEGNANQNKLGIPILFGGSLSADDQNQIRRRINEAKDKEKTLPYLFMFESRA